MKIQIEIEGLPQQPLIPIEIGRRDLPVSIPSQCRGARGGQAFGRRDLPVSIPPQCRGARGGQAPALCAKQLSHVTLQSGVCN